MFLTTITHAMSARKYHAHPGINASTLKAVAKHPLAKVLWDREHRVHKPAFDIGTAAHSLILEGHLNDVEVVDADSWRTKAAKEQAEAIRAAGQTPMLAHEVAPIEDMAASVHAHPVAGDLLQNIAAEVSVFGELYGTQAKARLDGWHEDTADIVDLKTVQSADPAEFHRDVLRWGYHQQAAHYADLMRDVTGKDHHFTFVLVEKAPPYLVSVVTLDEDFLDLGREQNEKAAQTWLNRPVLPINGWPGTTTIQCPVWALPDDDDDDFKEIL